MRQVRQILRIEALAPKESGIAMLEIAASSISASMGEAEIILLAAAGYSNSAIKCE